MRHQQANAKAASAARAEDPLVALPLKLKSIMELLPSPSILTPEELDVLHDAGARLYARGAWKEASDLFGLINLLRPLEPRYLNAQGKCLKMLKDFEGASEVFLLAWEMDRKLPENAVHAVECLLHAKKKSAALHLLRSLLDESDTLALDTPLRQKAEAWMSLLVPEKEHG